MANLSTSPLLFNLCLFFLVSALASTFPSSPVPSPMPTPTPTPTPSVPAHQLFRWCLYSRGFPLNSSKVQVLTPQDASYQSVYSTLTYNARSISSPGAQRPQVIVIPYNEADIKAAVFCAKKHDLQVRVRSGGHDYEGLSYVSTVPCVIIDLENFRQVTVDVQSKTARVQAGATIGELYYAIIEKSNTLAFTAGACPPVGVGGHFSGGGYGVISRKFGLSVDNIIDARVLTADGQILNRKTMREDLFWAIRGGGGASFAVIVEWTVKLVDIPEKVTVFTVSRLWQQGAAKLAHKWQSFATTTDKDLVVRVYIEAVPNNRTTGKNTTVQVQFAGMFLGGVDSLMPLMQQGFPELGLLRNDCTEMTWNESLLYFAVPSGFGLLYRTNLTAGYFKAKSDFVMEAISEDGFNKIFAKIGDEGVPEGSITASVELSPFGGRISEISDSATPFPHRSSLFMIHYLTGWFNNSTSTMEANMRWAQNFHDFLTDYVSKNPRGAYINYRDLDLGVNDMAASYEQAKIWGTKYFKGNFDRLVRVKTRVDPDNFFRNEQSIPLWP